MCLLRSAAIAATGLLLLGCTKQGTPSLDEPAENPDKLSGAAALHDIEIARGTLEQMHPGYARYTPLTELTAMWSSLEKAAANGISRGQLYLELSRILAAIRCDHTKAELPDDMAALRDTEPVYLPFRFVLFDRRMYVDEAVDGIGLARGDEILTIDGRSVEGWLEDVEPLVPVDGDADHVKPLEIAYSTEFMGPALDHFAPFLASLNDTVVLTVRGTDGRSRTVTASRQTYPAYLSMVGESRYSSNFKNGVRFERIGDDAAYLAVDTFVNYRQPVNAMTLLAPYFQSLKAEDRGRLILDLRQNGGGSDDAQAALLRHLITRPLRIRDAVLTRFNTIDDARRQYLDTWDEAALDPDPGWFEAAGDGFFRLVAAEIVGDGAPLMPAEDAFDGELTVLIGPANSSGSTHLIAALETAGRATFIGERTGGAPTGATAGVIYFLTLPESGIRVRVPGQRTVIADADRLPARNGIEPDILIVESAEHYFAGQDPALEVARAFFTR